MLTAFLFPVLLSLAVHLIQQVASKSRGIPAGEHPAFRFSKGLRISLWLGVPVVTIGPIVGTWSDGPIGLAYWIIFGAMLVLGLASCVYFDRYVVQFWNDRVSYGAFKIHELAYADIVSAEMVAAGQGTRVLVVKTSTKRVVISGYLSSIDDAARLLQSKLSQGR